MSLNGSGVCPEEYAPQSADSPGIVRDEEMLARIISKRAHLKNGIVSDDFFTLEDLRTRDGWSFVRRHYADDQRMRKIGEQRVKEKSGREYVGYVQIQTAHIRAIRRDDKQALCVIDDAQKDYKEHALVQKSAPCGKADARAIRKKLKDAAQFVRA